MDSFIVCVGMADTKVKRLMTNPNQSIQLRVYWVHRGKTNVVFCSPAINCTFMKVLILLVLARNYIRKVLVDFSGCSWDTDVYEWGKCLRYVVV